MEIEKVDGAGVTTLQVSGEIDLHASPALRGALQKCAAAKAPCVLLDFSKVTYIDSSGLATLIEYVRESSGFKGKFGLFGLQKKVQTIFDLVRLNELFVIGESEAAVLAALGGK